MATISLILSPQTAVPASTNGARHTLFDGTNFPVPSLAFAATPDQSVYFFFRAVGYGSGNVTVGVDWYADTASSGDVVWGAQVACITPNTDTQDIETDAFDTASTVTDSHLGTTNQRLHTADVAVSNVDSVAADDWVCLRLYRDVEPSDTMTGDALVTMVTVSYSDT